MTTFSPIWLVFIGLSLNFVGAFLISIEAIGASEFLRSLNSDDVKTSRYARISYVSTINATFVYILVSIISFFILWIFVQTFNVVLDLMISPLVFFAWKLSIKLTNWLTAIIELFVPPRGLHERGLFFRKRSGGFG